MALLAYGHLRVARRYATDHRRVAALAVGEHAVVGLDLRPSEADRREDIPWRRAVPHAQPPAPCGNVALHVQVGPVPACIVAIVVIGSIAPQPPGAKVQPVPEAGVVRV